MVESIPKISIGPIFSRRSSSYGLTGCAGLVLDPEHVEGNQYLDFEIASIPDAKNKLDLKFLTQFVNKRVNEFNFGMVNVF